MQNIGATWDRYESLMYLVILFQSVTKMIQEACTYVEKTPNLDIKLKLIDTLRTVTAGKVSDYSTFLERVL
jgi:hypothetical protein